MKATQMFSVYLSILCIFGVFSEAKLSNAQCSTQQYRLHYHYSVHENWTNDPNGLVYYDGVYHLFYQYHPYSTQWGPMHWGHAVSPDLVAWEELDIALYPDDVGTIFSGSAILDFGNSSGFQVSPGIPAIVAIYTSDGAQGQRQSLAYSNDKGMQFEKFDGNPVLSDPTNRDFRDPKVFKDRITGKWTMVLSVARKLEFYGSEDLKTWTKLSEFPWDLQVGVFECPDLVELPREDGNGTVWVLISSVSPGEGPTGGAGTLYYPGNWNGTHFITFPWTPNQWLDWGPDNYAGVTWSNDPLNRTILIGWMANAAYSGSIPTSTWRGQMTIPRQLTLHALDAASNQFRVKSNPPQELESLRHPLQHIGLSQEFTVLPHSTVTLTDQAGFRNPAMEVVITLEMLNEPKFSLCAHNSLGEEVCFGYNATKWFLDRTKSGKIDFNEQFQRSSYSTGPREVTDQQTTIKMYLDTSSIEVFVDEGLTAMTALIFPTETLNRLYIHHWSGATSGAVLSVKKLDIWGLVCTVQDGK